MKVKLLKLNCLRCRHEWAPRKTEVNMCPKCKTKYWNKTRTYDIARKQKKLVKILFSVLEMDDFLTKARNELKRAG